MITTRANQIATVIIPVAHQDRSRRRGADVDAQVSRMGAPAPPMF